MAKKRRASAEAIRKKSYRHNENKETLFELIYSCILIGGGILALLFALGAFDNEYNPETDVCLECSHKFEGAGYLNYQGDCSEVQDANYYRCDSWRPKTICELNPNDEDCICDEIKCIYQNEKDYHMATLQPFKDFQDCPEEAGGVCKVSKEGKEICYMNKLKGHNCIKSHPPSKPIKIDLEKEKCVEWITEGRTGLPSNELIDDRFPCGDVYQWFIERDNKEYYAEGLDKYCCLAKESLNECEKNNHEWIEDNETVYITKSPYSKEILICKKKTLQDITCPEMKTSLKHFCTPTGFCRLEPSKFFGNKQLSFDKDDMLIEFIERCGGTR